MRHASAYLFLSAALLWAVGCGGGGTATTPGPNPAQSAQVQGDVTQVGSFVSNALVVAYDVTTGVEVGNTRTDIQGHYNLNLPVGQFGLWVAADAGATGPIWINVPESLEVGMVDLAVTTSPTGLLIGRVVDEENGYPIPTALVKFGGQSVATDAYGFYTITGVGMAPVGSVEVTAPGYSATAEPVRGAALDRTQLLTTKFFTVRPTTDTGTSIGGQVRDKTTGAPLGGALLTLSRPLEPTFTPIHGQSNLGGYWRYYNLPSGTYQIDVHREGYVDSSGQAVINDQDGILNIFLESDPGARTTIAGIVTAENGTTPLNNVTVIASSGVFGAVIGLTNASGSFSIPNVVVDVPYTVTFRPPNNVVQTVIAVLTPPAEGLFLNPVILPQNNVGGISGRVTVTGLTPPPVGALIEAEKVGGSQSGQVFPTWVDVNGNYGINNLPAGSYIIRAIYTDCNGTETQLDLIGSTDVLAGQITKRNLAFPAPNPACIDV